jgi:hypothetical protein
MVFLSRNYKTLKQVMMGGSDDGDRPLTERGLLGVGGEMVGRSRRESIPEIFKDRKVETKSANAGNWVEQYRLMNQQEQRHKVFMGYLKKDSENTIAQ